MAGRSNIIWWLEQNGYEVTDGLVSHLFEVAKSQRRNMLDSEVETVVHQFFESVVTQILDRCPSFLIGHSVDPFTVNASTTPSLHRVQPH